MSKKQRLMLPATVGWILLAVPMIPIALVLRVLLLTWRAYFRAGRYLEALYLGR